MICINNIKIRAVASNVPKLRVDNLEIPGHSQEKLEKFVNTTGVRYRHLAESGTECTSDLCFAAAKRIIEDLSIDLNEIGVVILVSQSTDYILPATSCILQNRLGLGTDTIAFDINLGCSGYVYGLYIASTVLAGSGKKYALLLAGDTSSEHISKSDQSAMFLFGDAGTATLLEKTETGLNHEFQFGTDGAGADCLIIKAGAARNPITAECLIPKEGIDGNYRADNQLYMDGMEIFNFAISTVVDGVRSFMGPIDDYEAVVFHQANMFMLDTMRKMLKIPKPKFMYSLGEYGNTSSASIPTTICKLNSGIELTAKYLLAGFGVGLSWGLASINFDNTKILSIEIGAQ